jgi:hypothetical protein
MNFTIELGWWLLPLVITGVSFFAAWYAHKEVELNDERGDVFGDALVDTITFLICYGSATIASLAAWFIYAILN